MASISFKEKLCAFLHKYGRITIFGSTYGILTLEAWCKKKEK